MATADSKLLVALHSTITHRQKRSAIWSQNASAYGLEVVEDKPTLSLDNNAVLVVGSDFVNRPSDPNLTQRLQQSGAPVVQDTWLSACIDAKARVPFGKHQVQPPPARTVVNAAAAGGAAGHKRSHPQLDNGLFQTQLQHNSISISATTTNNLGSPVQAAAGGGGSGRGGSGVDLIPQSPGTPLTTTQLPPLPKRQHRLTAGSQPSAAAAATTHNNTSSMGGSSSSQHSRGLGPLDMAAATAAAAAATQQVLGGAAVVSSITRDALRTFVATRAWVPASSVAAAGAAAAAGVAAVNGLSQTNQSTRQQPQQQQQQELPSSLAAAAGSNDNSSSVCATTPQAGCFRVVCYNVLADILIHGTAKSYCRLAFKQWSSRWPRLAGELGAYQPDILAMSEVDEGLWRSHWQPLLQQQLGLTGLYHPRWYTRDDDDDSGSDDGSSGSGSNGGGGSGSGGGNGGGGSSGRIGNREGLALLWRAGRFRLLAHKKVVFREMLPTNTAPGEDAFWALVSRFSEGALMCLLQCTTTNKQVLAVSTHLWYDPRLPHVKAGQAHLLCKAVVDFRRELQQQGTMPPRGPLGQQQQQEEVPVLVCGDFNSLWKHDLRDPFNTWLSDGSLITPVNPLRSGVYELMSTGSLPPTHPHHPAKRWFGGVWPAAPPTPPPPAVAAAAAAGGSAASAPTPNDAHPSSSTPAAAAGSAGSSAAKPPAQQQPPAGSAAAAGSAVSAGPTPTNLSTHGLQLQSAYHAARGFEPPLTTKHPSFAGCLDYCWVSRQGLQVVGVLRMPYEYLQQAGAAGLGELAAHDTPFGSIPDAVFPSDHLSVGAVLKFS